MSLILDGTNGLSDVDGSAATPAIRGTDTNTGIFFPAADTIAFSEGGVESMRIDSNGNVGIGTTTPDVFGRGDQRNVGVSVPSTGDNLALSLNAGASAGRGSQIYMGAGGTRLFTISSNATESTIETATSTPLRFSTNSSERMRISSGGNVGIGTTAVTDQRLNVVDGGTLARIFRAAADSGSFAGVLIEGYGARTTTNGSYTLIDVLNGNVTGRFRVLDSGNAQNTNSSYGGLSDIRLKENIVDATPKLDDLCKVKVRHYNFKNKPNEKQIGVIAQELEEVFAGLVEETADKDAEGNDLGTTTKSVKYSVFVPMLIKAMQEQQQIINDLKTSVEAQAVRIAELEGV